MIAWLVPLVLWASSGTGIAAPAGETAAAAGWAADRLGGDESLCPAPPFSFVYGGRRSADL